MAKWEQTTFSYYNLSLYLYVKHFFFKVQQSKKQSGHENRYVITDDCVKQNSNILLHV